MAFMGCRISDLIACKHSKTRMGSKFVFAFQYASPPERKPKARQSTFRDSRRVVLNDGFHSVFHLGKDRDMRPLSPFMLPDPFALASPEDSSHPASRSE